MHEVNKKFVKSSYFVTELKLCLVRLINNKKFSNPKPSAHVTKSQYGLMVISMFFFLQLSRYLIAVLIEEN